MLRRLLFSGLILLATSGVARGDPAPEQHLDRRPDWLTSPSEANLLAVFPNNQDAMEHGGEAVLNCIVTVQGALRDCHVQSESPAGAGFGAAALAAAPQFAFRPGMAGGHAVESRVTIPMHWPRQFHSLTAAPARAYISDVTWSRAPTYADLAAATPAGARRSGGSGHVVLGCSFRLNGEVRDCMVISEAPLGSGYGAAAQSLARRFQMNLQTLPEGFSLADSDVAIPVSFPAGVSANPTLAPIHPRWTSAPTGEQAFAAYPTAALATRSSGRGVVACHIDAQGGLTGCAVESESPPGQGFGAAVLSLTPLFRANLWSEDGLPTAGAPVRVPITFHPPEPDPPSSSH